MQVLMAVIDDLWQFAFTGLFGARIPTRLDREREVQAVLPLPPAHRVSEIPAHAHQTASFRTGEQYFIGEIGTYLYSDPVIAFDTARREISYGHSVLVKKLGGRWAEVVYEGTSGWILKDVLRERREDIHPQLHAEVYYDAANSETVKLRACINDEFGGARADLPLTAAEYVAYKLFLAKRQIDWPSDGPRVAGSWQKRLRGLPGIHISILPSTGSVMEYVIDDVGYLAFVEAVFPDSSIKITEVGATEEGQFTERIMNKEEFREYRPVFIEVI